MADTRQSKRTPVTLKIKFKSETLEQFIERYAVDVSHGGIFIRTKDPLPVGTTMKFEFQLKDASPLIKGGGTVVWTREHDPTRTGVAPGMGVRFDRLGDGSREILDQILARKASKTSSTGFTDMPTRVAPSPLVNNLAQRSQNRTSSSSFSEGGPKSGGATPFATDAGEFPEEAFEEATKIRSMAELAALSKNADVAATLSDMADEEGGQGARRRADSEGPTRIVGDAGAFGDTEGPTRLVDNPLIHDLKSDVGGGGPIDDPIDDETSFADLNESSGRSDRAETVPLEGSGVSLDDLPQPELSAPSDRDAGATLSDVSSFDDDEKTMDKSVSQPAPDDASSAGAFTAALARAASSSEGASRSGLDDDLLPDPLEATPGPAKPSGMTDHLATLDAALSGVAMEDDEPTSVRGKPASPPPRTASAEPPAATPPASEPASDAPLETMDIDAAGLDLGSGGAEAGQSAAPAAIESVFDKTAAVPGRGDKGIEKASGKDSGTAVDTSDDDDSNKTMLIAIGGVAVLIIVVIGYFLFAGGKKNKTEEPAVPAVAIDAAPRVIDAAARKAIDAAPIDAMPIDAGVKIPDDAEMVKVTVRSSPAKMNAELVGTDQTGATPAVFEVAKGVEYTVRLSKDGYRPQEITIDGSKLTTPRVKMVLTPMILRITSDPPGAHGYVDGRRVPGVTPTTFTLPQSFRARKQLKLSLRLSGYAKLNLMVDNTGYKPEGDTLVLDVGGTFTPKGAKPGAVRKKPTVGGGADEPANRPADPPAEPDVSPEEPKAAPAEPKAAPAESIGSTGPTPGS